MLLSPVCRICSVRDLPSFLGTLGFGLSLTLDTKPSGRPQSHLGRQVTEALSQFPEPEKPSFSHSLTHASLSRTTVGETSLRTVNLFWLPSAQIVSALLRDSA